MTQGKGAETVTHGGGQIASVTILKALHILESPNFETWESDAVSPTSAVNNNL